jgi:hypothetical protein
MFQLCYTGWLERHSHGSSNEQRNDVKPPTEEGDGNKEGAFRVRFRVAWRRAVR